MRRFQTLSFVTLVGSLLFSAQASAGAVTDLYRGGAYGLPWNATKDTIQAKYPGGKWVQNDKGQEQYCAASKQTLLKLPAPHQSRELCFVIGSDGTLASATAVMDASLPSLLAIVNRCRTTFGDFDAVVRDQQAIQSRSTAMLWTKDKQYVVRIVSENDTDGRPLMVSYTVADEPDMYTSGAAKVSNIPGSR
jgi:hypothetical protein